MNYKKLLSALLFALSCGQAINAVVPKFSNVEYSENVCYGLYNDSDCKETSCSCGMSIMYKNIPYPLELMLNPVDVNGLPALYCFINENTPCYQNVLDSLYKSFERASKLENPQANELTKKIVATMTSRENLESYLLFDNEGQKVIKGMFPFGEEYSANIFTKKYLEEEFKGKSHEEMDEFLHNDTHLCFPLGYLYCKNLYEPREQELMNGNSERLISIICLSKFYFGLENINGVPEEVVLYDSTGNPFFVMQVRFDIDMMPLTFYKNKGLMPEAPEEAEIFCSLPEGSLRPYYVDNSIVVEELQKIREKEALVSDNEETSRECV